MITSMGYGTYMFFGALMILMGFWALFFIPETKGLTLEDMDRLFAVSTAKTVWQSMVQRRPMEEVLAERRENTRIYNEKETALEQVESVDGTKRA